MSHVKGHPSDPVRDFIQHMVDADVGGLIPSMVEAKGRDRLGRVVSRGRIPLSLGAGVLGLLMTTRFQKSPEEREKRRQQLLEEIEALREGHQGFTDKPEASE